MNSSTNGFEVTKQGEEITIIYQSLMLPLFFSVPVVVLLCLLYWIVSLSVAILLGFLWLGFLTINNWQKTIIIVDNRLIVNSTSIRLDEVKSLIVSNLLDEEIEVPISNVITSKGNFKNEDLDALLASDNFKSIFSIEVKYGNNSVSKIATALNKEQTKALVEYFACGQYLLDEETAITGSSEK